MYKHFFKRVIDFFVSLIGFIVLLLPMLIIAIAIKCDSKGPVLFKQKRVGKDKKLFNILKFRTMRIDTPRDAPTHELSDPKKWITKVGGFLRKTSLDELPQIINIILGQMSIIGPRPALWNQDDLIAERDKYGANDIKPGLTGWAQINGRDELEIPVKAALDGEYVEKMGFFFDLKCFFGTFASVLKSDGVVEGGTGEMKKQQKESEKDSLEDKKEIITEKSCGAIVFTKDNDGIKYVIIESKEGFYGFPKGHVENDETELETAKREVYEETGLQVKFLDNFKTEDSHPFKRNGETRMKHIVYFLAEFSGQSPRAQESELNSIHLMDYETAMSSFQFENSKRILKEAHKFLLG